MSHSGGGYSSAPSAPPAPSSPYQSWQPGQSTAYSSSPYAQPPSASPGMSPAPPYASPYSSGSGAPPSYGGAAPTPPYGGPPSAPWAQPPSGYPYGYPQQPPQPGYGQFGAQFPPGTDPEIVRAFQGADRDGSGTIDDMELQTALSAGQPFSLRTVHLMLHQFANNAKRIGPTEFATLWKALRDWRGTFERFDRDRSGRIETGELRDALLSLGYAVPPSVLQILVSKYDKTGQARGLDYDNFVECGLVVKGLTEKFKEKDVKLTGSATLSYEAFMLMVLPFIVA
ncbi:probable calcium-binding protein CML50 isoform X2 [Selaginella moellendorffii]|uniref:probable calcium-binding protein CML50 isoform X2 n=1 Tax=Selaginella moellendorffii TaxID=88036 RepID=UPI000D1C5773|nr:probable calcium-binding protein CML50 isoform X2 [Selaginella moellendorffii]|eukprot:XP_002979697.2 probable calcium-binding protein CML50 isoform X2 [Selaginella moellendorffii]